jgi:hypothetical protein
MGLDVLDHETPLVFPLTNGLPETDFPKAFNEHQVYIDLRILKTIGIGRRDGNSGPLANGFRRAKYGLDIFAAHPEVELIKIMTAEQFRYR